MWEWIAGKKHILNRNENRLERATLTYLVINGISVSVLSGFRFSSGQTEIEGGRIIPKYLVITYCRVGKSKFRVSVAHPAYSLDKSLISVKEALRSVAQDNIGIGRLRFKLFALISMVKIRIFHHYLCPISQVQNKNSLLKSWLQIRYWKSNLLHLTSSLPLLSWMHSHNATQLVVWILFSFSILDIAQTSVVRLFCRHSTVTLYSFVKIAPKTFRKYRSSCISIVREELYWNHLRLFVFDKWTPTYRISSTLLLIWKLLMSRNDSFSSVIYISWLSSLNAVVDNI